jgi:hypothetical protein
MYLFLSECKQREGAFLDVEKVWHRRMKVERRHQLFRIEIGAACPKEMDFH